MQTPFTNPGDDELPAKKLAESGGYECIPPAKYADIPVQCATRATAEVTKKRPIAGAPDNLGEKKSPFSKGGQDSLTECTKSWEFQFSKSGIKEWGAYELTGRVFVKNCVWRDYYSKDPKEQSTPQDYMTCPNNDHVKNPPLTDKVEIFCPGDDLADPQAWYHLDEFHNNKHLFTAERCGDNGTQQWTCGPPSKPSFDGKEMQGPFEVVDDGRVRPATWDQPDLGGIVIKDSVHATQTVLDFEKDSTPFRVGYDFNGPTQPFTVTPDLNATLPNWHAASPNNSGKTRWDIAYFAAGMADTPVQDRSWRARPEWRFTADFRTKVVDTITLGLQENGYRHHLEERVLLVHRNVRRRTTRSGRLPGASHVPLTNTLTANAPILTRGSGGGISHQPLSTARLRPQQAGRTHTHRSHTRISTTLTLPGTVHFWCRIVQSGDCGSDSLPRTVLGVVVAFSAASDTISPPAGNPIGEGDLLGDAHWAGCTLK